MKTKLDIMFDAILAKNQLARLVKRGTLPREISVDLVAIENALAIGMKRLNARDNQPSVIEIINCNEFDL